jgi:hypothetical protein
MEKGGTPAGAFGVLKFDRDDDKHKIAVMMTAWLTHFVRDCPKLTVVALNC